MYDVNDRWGEMLKVQQLSKSFGDLKAVNGVSFTVERGTCFGLLGPNGAGKTTTISMIVGILKPDHGSVEINGKPISSDTDPLKHAIGFVPQDLALYEELTATANLQFFGALYGYCGNDLTKRIGQALELVELSDRSGDKVGTYSGGMKRRLNIATALLQSPDLMILDEPTVGVDPQSRNAIFETLQRLQSTGVTLIYTTHYMEEVERLCDRIAIIDHGEVIANDTLEGLNKSLQTESALVVEFEEGAILGKLLEDLTRLPFILNATATNNRVRVSVEHLPQGVAIVSEYLNSNNIPYDSLQTQRVSLEEVFLEKTGRSLRD